MFRCISVGSGVQRALLAALFTASATAAASADAQGPPPPGGLQRAEAVAQRENRVSNSRLARYTGLGALTGAALALGYWSVSEEGQRGSDCRPLECALPYLTISGAIAGLFLGRELEMQRIALAPREGDVVRYASTAVKLVAPPTFFDARDTLLVVASDSGAQLVSATQPPRALATRAAGLRSIRQVTLLPTRGTLAIGTATALWEAPISSGPARRVSEGAVTALGASPGSLLSASGSTLLLHRSEPTARMDSLDVGSAVDAVAWDSVDGVWWVAADSMLIRVRETQAGLERGGQLGLPAPGRRIALSAGYVAVALGDAGLIAWPRAALTSAQQGGVIAPLRLSGEPRFVFDADFDGDLLYVAAGVDGLYRVALEDAPRVLDSTRQFPFVTLVKVEQGVVWIGDRGKMELVRLR